MASRSSSTNENIRLRLTEVFRKVFDNPKIELHDDLTAAQVEGWDSLTHIDMIVEVERAFKVKFTTAEISGLKNVGELLKLLELKLVNR